MVRSEKSKRLIMVSRLLFIIYMIFALYVLLMAESFGRTVTDQYRYNLVPFMEIKRFYSLLGTGWNGKAFLNLFGNVLCFMPFGFYQAIEFRNKKAMIRKVTLCTFFFSFCVEIVQLIFKIGIFDVDDLILNTTGGILGGILYKLLRWVMSFGKNGGAQT